ncbi:MAG: response regulator [Anaerolineales bacterium]|nr:response regulator [Anaerolineales bacterium]
MKDYYAILEVPPTASQETIREQYYFLIQAWHPDKFYNPIQKAKAEEKSKEINTAYDVLKNLQKRAQYDSERSGQSSRLREEQKRRQTEEQRQRKQAEETQRRVDYERQQRERAEEERRRTDYERQKQEKAEQEKRRVENEQAQRKQSKQPPAEVNRNFQNPIRVLIVDDMKDTRGILCDFLRDINDIVVVGEASDGEEAIEQYDLLTPDVMTTCINMPRLDGISAIEKIRNRHPNAKVIICSVQNDINYKRRASYAGAKEYLEKPFLGKEYIDAIRRVADQGTP